MPNDQKTMSRAERMLGRTKALEGRAAEVNREGRVQAKGDTGVGGLMRHQAHRKADLLDTKYAGGEANPVMPLKTSDIRKGPYRNRLPSSFDPEVNTAFASLLEDIRIQKRNLQPIQVRRLDDAAEGEPQFQLITGERRWRCCQLLQIPVWAEVLEIDDAGAMALMFSENQHRKDLSAVERGQQIESFLTVMRSGSSGRVSRGSVKELAEDLGLNADYVSRAALIGQIPDTILALMEHPERLTYVVALELAKAWRDESDKVQQRAESLGRAEFETDKHKALYLAGKMEPAPATPAKTSTPVRGVRMRLPNDAAKSKRILTLLRKLEREEGVDLGLEEFELRGEGE